MAIPVIQFLMSATPSLKTQCLEHNVSYLSFLTTSWLSQWTSSWTHYNGVCHLPSWRNIGRVFFSKVNVSGSSWPHGKLSLIWKVKCSPVEKCTHNFKSMGRVWKWGCFYFSLTFMKCSFPHDEILLGPIWWNLVHEVITSESSRELCYPFLRQYSITLALPWPLHSFYPSFIFLLSLGGNSTTLLTYSGFFPFEASTPSEKFLYSCLLVSSME